jgi:hypothetical protein
LNLVGFLIIDQFSLTRRGKYGDLINASAHILVDRTFVCTSYNDTNTVLDQERS